MATLKPSSNGAAASPFAELYARTVTTQKALAATRGNPTSAGLGLLERQLQALSSEIEEASLLWEEVESVSEREEAAAQIECAKQARVDISSEVRQIVRAHRVTLERNARNELFNSAQIASGNAERASVGDMAVSITNSLRRTHALLDAEISRTLATTEVVDQQNKTLENTQQTYEGMSHRTRKGTTAVKRLRVREKVEQWAVHLALIIFFVMVLFVVKRRSTISSIKLDTDFARNAHIRHVVGEPSKSTEIADADRRRPEKDMDPVDVALAGGRQGWADASCETLTADDSACMFRNLEPTSVHSAASPLVDASDEALRVRRRTEDGTEIVEVNSDLLDELWEAEDDPRSEAEMDIERESADEHRWSQKSGPDESFTEQEDDVEKESLNEHHEEDESVDEDMLAEQEEYGERQAPDIREGDEAVHDKPHFTDQEEHGDGLSPDIYPARDEPVRDESFVDGDESSSERDGLVDDAGNCEDKESVVEEGIAGREAEKWDGQRGNGELLGYGHTAEREEQSAGSVDARADMLTEVKEARRDHHTERSRSDGTQNAMEPPETVQDLHQSPSDFDLDAPGDLMEDSEPVVERAQPAQDSSEELEYEHDGSEYENIVGRNVDHKLRTHEFDSSHVHGDGGDHASEFAGVQEDISRPGEPVGSSRDSARADFLASDFSDEKYSPDATHDFTMTSIDAHLKEAGEEHASSKPVSGDAESPSAVQCQDEAYLSDATYDSVMPADVGDVSSEAKEEVQSPGAEVVQLEEGTNQQNKVVADVETGRKSESAESDASDSNANNKSELSDSNEKIEDDLIADVIDTLDAGT